MCSKCDEAVEAPAKKARLDPFADLRTGGTTTSAATPVSISVDEELASYKSSRISTVTAPLLFWKQQASQYPILSTVARRVLAISASSAKYTILMSATFHQLADL